MAGGVAVITLLLGFGLTRDPTALNSPLVGRKAPEFSLPLLEGSGMVRLADLRGQVVVVNFWASWCLACRCEHPNFIAAWQRYRNQGVAVVGIVYQDSPADARRYVHDFGGDWPRALDPGGHMAIDYGVVGVPETFFIDRSGRVAYKEVGYSSYGLLVQEIERLLDQRRTSR